MEPNEYTAERVYWNSRNSVPRYSILETVEDRITGKTWHKLDVNIKAAELIMASKSYSQWGVHSEVDSTRYLWVTNKLLTILHIQGLQHR